MDKNTIVIKIKLGGRQICTVELSCLEIRTLRAIDFEEAVERILDKVHLPHGAAVQVLNHIKSGNFEVYEE